jgi:hypothetical protein
MNFITRVPLCLAALMASTVTVTVTDAFSPSPLHQSVWKSTQSLPTSGLRHDHTHLPVMSMSEVETETSMSSNPDEDNENNEPKPECASLLPGQVVTIRIGDTSLARKAWKKRRRSGSPILVPCTIMGMNRDLMVKYNLINLLHRFGRSSQGNSNNNGVVLTVGALVKLYKYRLGGDLLQHAKAFGYGTIVAYLRSVFDQEFAEESGIKIIRTGAKNELALASSLSIRVARESAYDAEFVQFIVSDNGDDNRMLHSGTTFQIANNKEKYNTIAAMDSSTIQPLSAAVRIAHADEVSNRLTSGMECNAFLHSYDINGDNGSPLLICSIDPPQTQIRNQVKRRSYVRRQMSKSNSDIELMKSLDGEASLDLKDLHAGDGPFQATVVRVSERSGAAFVDLGVSRQKGKKHGGGKARILGMLRFEDAAEGTNSHDENVVSKELTEEEVALIEESIRDGLDDDETIEEDVTAMFKMDEDGNMFSIDPITKESMIIGSVNDEVDESDDSEDDDNMFSGMSPEERLSAIGDMLAEEEEKQVKKSNEVSLQVGDEMEVFVRAVFPQSGRFMVTTDKNVKEHKLKDEKQEKEAEKRLERLASKMGGDNGLQQILDAKGEIMEGVIKANSKSGDWYYVQPLSDDGLPVGIGVSEVEGPLSAGDKVQIRMDGIDYSRGQLSLKIIEKL